MTTSDTSHDTKTLVFSGPENGITGIHPGTPLTRLNYFDGKFLRAKDLVVEQNYLYALAQLSNQAGGQGIAYGFDVIQLSAMRLRVDPGLAIDPKGRVLLLTGTVEVNLMELIEKSRGLSVSTKSEFAAKGGKFAPCEPVAKEGSTPLATEELYVITISRAERLCGHEDVYGKLCEEACITSTDRPYHLEGVLVRAIPLSLPAFQKFGAALGAHHWQSQVASVYYAVEGDKFVGVASSIFKAGLESNIWCHGAWAAADADVALAVVGVRGGSIRFLDEWIVRRERMDTFAKHYWQWRMAMRPWNVFMAQILQFQCQLHDCFAHHGMADDPNDPCQQARQLVGEAAGHFEILTQWYTAASQDLANFMKAAPVEAGSTKLRIDPAGFAAFKARLVKATAEFKSLPTNRFLIQCGIVELPSAGYLPVVPSATLTVNQQVRRLMGEGVDLRFCVVRPDYVAHALEEAQHMERISLLEGLENAKKKPHVDVLVPNGTISLDRVERSRFYDMRMNVILQNWLPLIAAARRARRVQELKEDVAWSAFHSSTDENLKLKQDYLKEPLTDYLATLMRAGRADEPFEFNGAARSERLNESGVAFYYAGITGRFFIEQPKAESPQPAPAPPGFAAPAPAPAPAVTVSFLKHPAFTKALRAQLFNVHEYFDLQKAKPQAHSSIWVSLQTETDPSELNPGASTSVKAECRLLLEASGQPVGHVAANANASLGILIEASFIGELLVEAQDSQPGNEQVRSTKAALSGNLNVKLKIGPQEQTGDLTLSEPVFIHRKTSQHGPKFRIELPASSILQPLVAELGIARSWNSATQAEAEGTIAFRAPNPGQPFEIDSHFVNPVHAGAGDSGFSMALADALLLEKVKKLDRSLFHAWQSLKPAVREPNHPAHQQSIAAVRNIGRAMASASFDKLAANRLFPASLTTESELSILATEGWVLFHRRREKQCRRDTPATPVETRQYALYHLQLPNDRVDIDDLAKLLESGKTDPEFVQWVEFGAGIHAVISPAGPLHAAWKQAIPAHPGNILGGCIASRGVAAAEGNRMAQDRLESLVELLRAVTPVDPAAKHLVLSRIPDRLDSLPNDGLIVVATRKWETVCHEVRVARSEEVFKAIGQQTGPAFVKLLLESSESLGKVLFESGTASLEGNTIDSVVEAWKQKFPAQPPSDNAVFFRTTDANQGLYEEQSKRILGAWTKPLGSTHLIAEDWPEGCPAITLLRPPQVAVLRKAFLTYSMVDNGFKEHLRLEEPAGPVEFQNNAPQGTTLTKLIQEFNSPQPLIHGVTLATVGAMPELPGANIRLNAVLKALPSQVAANLRSKQAVQLSADDRKRLSATINVNDFQDIIFLERLG